MIGIDIVDIARIKKIYQKHGRLFLEKILTDEEIIDLSAEKKDNFFRGLSCYIASKEAIFKACSEENLDWKEISIRNIKNNPSAFIKRPIKKKVHLSWTVDGDIVLSQALAEGGERYGYSQKVKGAGATNAR